MNFGYVTVNGVNSNECSVAERDDGIPVIVVAAVKETIS